VLANSTNLDHAVKPKQSPADVDPRFGEDFGMKADGISVFHSSHINLFQVCNWIRFRDPQYARPVVEDGIVSRRYIDGPVSHSDIQNLKDTLDGKVAARSASVDALLQLRTALGQGKLRASARPNGAGKPILLPAHYWPRLTFTNRERPFRSKEQSVFETCVCFKEESRGVYWSDIQFRADEILAVWPSKFEQNEHEHTPTRKTRLASDTLIHKTINQIYDEAEATGSKPPNVKEIVAPVQTKLQVAGYEASGRRIQQLADADVYKKRRRRPGPTLASEKRHQPR
jgi:hypothetical protein